MFLYEPPPSQGDLHFRLFGFPIRIHPWFWISTFLFGLNGGGETAPAELLTWVAVVFVSILVHELGHAVLQRHFGGHPWITLHAAGGLASCSDCDRRPLPQILISLAGPFAGFLLAAITMLAINLSGHRGGVSFGSHQILWDPAADGEPLGLPIAGMRFYWAALATDGANRLVQMLLFVNVLWGLVNLLPIYPLDGGRVSRELFMLGNPRRGIVASLWLSAIAAAGMAAFGWLQWHSFYTAIFFGYLAYGSYATIRAYQASRA